MSVPVLVGISQLDQRVGELSQAREPVDLMIDAVRAAAEDAGAPALATQADSVRVMRGFWRYQNPARAVCEAIGNAGAETGLTPFGGNYVQRVLNRSALDIQAGRHDVIIMTGAECGYSQARARRAGTKLRWRDIDGTPDLYIGEDGEMGHPVELALGIRRASQMYAIFETARRHRLGESVDAHLQRISELWAGFSRVAANNPHAWIREARTAEEIRTPSATNRPVTFPYPKLMNANNNVDQAAALILCSEAKARALGIPRDKWVYPWTGTDAKDHYLASNRDNFHSSPAIRIAGGRTLEAAGLTPGQLDFVDLYSCFPVAVQVAAAELGLDPARALTVTGGLTFAGGPLNNYVMHAIARMAELLRDPVPRASSPPTAASSAHMPSASIPPSRRQTAFNTPTRSAKSTRRHRPGGWCPTIRAPPKWKAIACCTAVAAPRGRTSRCACRVVNAPGPTAPTKTPYRP